MVIPCLIRGCTNEATEVLDHVDGNALLMCGGHSAGWFTSASRRRAVALEPEFGAVVATKVAFDDWLKIEEAATASLRFVRDAGGVRVLAEQLED